MKLKGTIPNLIPALLKLDLTAEFDLDVKPHKDKRSLTANSYYWSLLNQFARWAGRSDAYIHNDILAHYGQPYGEGFEAWIPDEPEAEFKAMESATYHMRPTDEVVWFEGENRRKWLLMKGSSEMDTGEFSRLVDGLIQTIQGSGADIETMTPAELETLKGYHGKA